MDVTRGEVRDQGQEIDWSERTIQVARDLATDTEMETEEQETKMSEIEVVQDHVTDAGMEIEVVEIETFVTGGIESGTGTRQEIEVQAEIGIEHVKASTRQTKQNVHVQLLTEVTEDRSMPSRTDRHKTRSRSPVRHDPKTRTRSPPPPRHAPPTKPKSTLPPSTKPSRMPPSGLPPAGLPPDEPKMEIDSPADPKNTKALTANGTASSTSKPKPEEPEDSDPEIAQMRALMGFAGFKSTKNTKVPGNNVYAVRKEKKTEYRQYMNRVGGFNRPLSPSR